MFMVRGVPGCIRSDNGPEFICKYPAKCILLDCLKS
jgi:hypothetical protein